ncbi:phosphoenolpyruvate--protein phosphotransferase [Microbacterium sp.]|uniref:phosphoenolpyruvate--protein phosphotransferase n=1 Tax=Microbacterium sp. TaxID=51671 RepID=UPI0033417630
MIGIVAVSHSARLAEAALELAQQMVPGGAVPVRLAAGAGTEPDGTPILGTDATAVSSAIDELAAGSEGVLVLMDLGSAVMSAELALELRMSDAPVRLVPAPFVEGLLAATVAASSGAGLDEVAAEASSALVAKSAQLGAEEDVSGPGPGGPRAGDGGMPRQRVVRVRNPLGIHARPAALIAEAARGSDVRLVRLPDGPDAPAASLSRLLLLGAREGDEIALHAAPDDVPAVERLVALFDDGFGEVPYPGGPASAREVSVPYPGGPASAREVSVPYPGGPASAADAPARARGVSPGRAVGVVAVLGAAVSEPPGGAVVAEEDRAGVAAQIAPAAAAVSAGLRERAAAAAGETRAILEATALLADDPELSAAAAGLVRTGGLSAARAVWEASAGQERALSALGGRMAERAADLRDIRDRVVAALLGVEVPGVPETEEPFVLAAVDLAPADTAALEGSACVALVTEQGGPTSHTAIIARALGLPAVVGFAGTSRLPVGTRVLVDGDSGEVLVDPDDAAVAAVAAASAVPSFDGHGGLSDGTAIALRANVGSAAEAQAAAEAGAEGIGLFRTEFCFLDRQDAPDVAEQTGAYRAVLAPFRGRRVVVRTLDAGSDKPLPFANAAHEDNPALGVRGLRIAQGNPGLLRDQLRAIAAAAGETGTDVEVMAPMVATVDEAASFAEECRAAGIARAGIMIETPSAALLAEEMLGVVDFVSLGTNDLAQYTMAADRLAAELGDLNDPWQPAVLRLIRLVGEAGRAAGKPVGVCGEAGADPVLAPVLVGLGVTSLSMAPRALARVAAALRVVSAEDCRRAAGAAASAATAAAARTAALTSLPRP